MTWKDRTIIIESVAIVLLIAACVGVWKFYTREKIVIKWRGPVTKTVYVKGSDADLRACYDSPIAIDGKQYDNKFLVTAGDACKSASRTLGVDMAVRHHVPMITYSPLFNIEAREFRHQLTGQYYYNFGPLALGGGATASFSNSKLHDIGPVIGLMAFVK